MDHREKEQVFSSISQERQKFLKELWGLALTQLEKQMARK
jgi:hypothetical protein